MLGGLAAVLLVLGSGGAVSMAMASAICVTDDTGQPLCLERPAERIVALSPNVTELLFAAGAGQHVVGAVSFSDYPPEARQLPRIGSHSRVDLEALLALAPDLVVAWSGGNPREQLERLGELGIAVFHADASTFETIATSLERLGKLAGTEQVAGQAAERLRREVAELTEQYHDAAPVDVFYEVWESPLMTINGEHWISRSLALCGGVNPFSEQSALVPRIAKEAVLASDPEAIISSGMGKADSSWLDAWRRYPQMTAVQRGNLFIIDPDLVQRATPRLVEGTRALCRQLDIARGRR